MTRLSRSCDPKNGTERDLAVIYADTSLLVSMFLPEPCSEQARRWLKKQQGVAFVSDLNILEFNNALNLALFYKRITESDHANISRQWMSMIEAESFQIEPVKAQVWDLAKQMSGQYTPKIGNRSLDVLHVAFASYFRCESFGTFDSKQRLLAEAVGLKLNPLD